MNYDQFLAEKKIVAPPSGFSVDKLNAGLFDFQRDIVKWALKRGRAAVFAGTGLGKSFVELSWAQHIYEETKKNVLIFTPLAVAAQMKREAEKFGIDVAHVHEQGNQPIQITNYQKLDKFDLSQFAGVVLDESSILKNFNGHYRTKLIQDCKIVPYRLAATATPSPNDYMELGNHAEFCGIMSYTDMLSTFFVHDGSETQQWRLKGHAEDAFWKWMASWSVMLQNPSDLGYDGSRYILPKLHQLQHTVDVEYAPNVDTGLLFPMEAQGLGERLKARRATIANRINKAYDLVIGSLGGNKCLGNQNTQQTENLNISPMQQNEKEGKLNPDQGKKISNTCDHTEKKDQKNLLNPKNKEAEDLNQNTELTNLSIKKSINHKKESAPFVEPQVSIHGEKDCMSITAIRKERSEDCCASTAIGELDNSETTTKSFLEPWLIWCHLNDEQDELEKLFGKLCFSVRGSDDDEDKERAVLDWIDGKRPIMISKMSILGFGMNFQHCRHTVFVGMNDSFEQIYQAVRRFWRFGQTKEVYAHFIASEIEGQVVQNIRRKEQQCEHMMRQMVKHMADFSSKEIRGATRDTRDYIPTQNMDIPSWL